MTPKERARLRGLANGIDTVLQIGKDGIGDTLILQADITLEARELIKGRVLDTCMDYTPRTAAEALAAATNSEVVQVIGSKFVLYRKRKDAPKKAEPSVQKEKPSGNRPRKAEAFQSGGARKSRDFGQRKPHNGDTFGQRKPRGSDASGQRKPHGDGARNPRDAKAAGQRKPRDNGTFGQRKPRDSGARDLRNGGARKPRDFGQRKPRDGDASRKANPRNGGTFARTDRKTRK